MKNHEPPITSDGLPDPSKLQFFQLLAKTEKYLYFSAKWKLIDNSTPDDLLLEVAMRVDDHDEYRLAHNIFCGLPKKSRLAYALHYGGGLSVSEIATMYGTTEEKVKRSLAKIRSLLGSNEIREMIIRFAVTELQFAADKCQNMSIAMMQKMGVDPSAVYGSIQTTEPSDTPIVTDFIRHSLNQIEENIDPDAPQ